MVQENRVMSEEKILVVCGPTASGKSALAVTLAEKYNGEIVSADSVSVYKKLNIGSAKPSQDEMRNIPHYMIDVVDEFENFSVSDYEKMALPIVYDILSRGKLPIICGGTGFYINSLLYERSYGMSRGNEDFRKLYNEKLRIYGNKFVWEELNAIDPQTAAKLHFNDTVRVVRALEIYYSTGIRKSEIMDSNTARFDYLAIMPNFKRDILYERINHRVELMIKNGLENEIRDLISDGVTLLNQCMQGIGYKESYEAIIKNEEIPVEDIKQNSRRYAKRQLTFFKKMQPYLFDVSGETSENELYKKIDDFL